jgi:predicted nucleotidyltransferase
MEIDAAMADLLLNEPVRSKQDVVAILRQHRDAIRVLGVKRLGLFGSFVREGQRPDSDVDLLVEFEPTQKTFDHFMALCFLLEDLLRRRVEVVTTESLSPYLRSHILDEVEDVTLAA